MSAFVERPPDDLAIWEEREAELRQAGVHYCLASYVDVHGVPKAKSVPIEHFGRMVRGSELFTGAALDGLGQDPSDDELSVWPDVESGVVLPWEPTVAWIPGELHFRGEPWPMCSRGVLRRQVDRLAAMGLVFNVGIESELFLVTIADGVLRPANPKDVLAKAAYDVAGLLENISFLDESVQYMNSLGWDVFSFDHEDANSQFEFDFAYSEAVTMADRFVLWRMMMKALARKRGIEATFMAKPYDNRTGNGAHFNMSMADSSDGRNAFADETDPRGCRLSELGYHFIGGLLEHAAAIVAVTAPTVNSYKRLIKRGSMTGYTWAPIFVSYGDNNRTHMLRIPSTSHRVELRAADSMCNPYLAEAIVLAAGLDGIERELDPGDPVPGNMYEANPDRLDELGITTLPRTLLGALQGFDADPLTEQVFGKELKESFLELKNREWWEYHNHVSSWEIERYATFF